MTKKALLGIALAALSFSATHSQAGDRQNKTGLTELETAYAPHGFQELCHYRPEFCVEERVAPQAGAIMSQIKRSFGENALSVGAPELTRQRRAVLERVNVEVNALISPVEDQNGDFWNFSAMAGDCEEYVLMKKEVLALSGWPRSAMRIAVVEGSNYPYHAVLLVNTDQGEFVLDNLTDKLMPLEESAYTFVLTQSQRQPGTWVMVSR
ncbi:MAG: transglutaminase-like cysteine peptidase [Neomegalonema sp.]|nr:transglutaminase-like cysteine peptidase [Neomegalonema sp.]